MEARVKPLVLDIDGTLLKTDMLFESFWSALGKHPWQTVRTTVRYFTRPAALKRELAGLADLRTDILPVNESVLELARREAAAGRIVVLASASDNGLVQQIALTHGFSAESLGSDGSHNLKGRSKARALCALYGDNGFDYAGDSRADRAVWQHAENAILVGSHPKIAASLARQGKNVAEIEGGWRWRDLLKALRPHQWVKNILLFLPMLAAHDFSVETFARVLVGVVAFSAAASSIYIVNDLLDLEADRLHATKCRRPFASGAVPISAGMAAFAALTVLAALVGASLGVWFLAVLGFYVVASLAYSLKLKRMRWIDIAMLAMLYTLRTVAGAAAGQVSVSVYMLIFVFPVFFTLGCVKRLTELTLAKSDERLPGRGYARSDRGDLLNMAALGTVGSLVVFFLYSLSEQAAQLYRDRWMLWVAMIPIALWLIRMVRLGYFGKQDYDPIVFALRDKRGIGLLLITLSLMFYAAGLWQRWLGFG